jgi:hypothetical protein
MASLLFSIYSTGKVGILYPTPEVKRCLAIFGHDHLAFAVEG